MNNSNGIFMMLVIPRVVCLQEQSQEEHWLYINKVHIRVQRMISIKAIPLFQNFLSAVLQSIDLHYGMQ